MDKVYARVSCECVCQSVNIKMYGSDASGPLEVPA